jgi:hypothetical protein
MAAGGCHGGRAGRRRRREQVRVELHRAARPTLRTSATPGSEASGDSSSASNGSISTTRSTSRSRSMMSMLTSPATHAPGWPAYGAAVEERRRRLVPERLPHAAARDHRAERHVAGADPLRARDQVGREAVALAAEPAAEAPEARDHLVADRGARPASRQIRSTSGQ